MQRLVQLSRARYDADTARVAQAVIELMDQSPTRSSKRTKPETAVEKREYGYFDFLEIVVAEAGDDFPLLECRVVRGDDPKTRFGGEPRDCRHNIFVDIKRDACVVWDKRTRRGVTLDNAACDELARRVISEDDAFGDDAKADITRVRDPIKTDNPRMRKLVPLVVIAYHIMLTRGTRTVDHWPSTYHDDEVAHACDILFNVDDRRRLVHAHTSPFAVMMVAKLLDMQARQRTKTIDDVYALLQRGDVPVCLGDAAGERGARSGSIQLYPTGELKLRSRDQTVQDNPFIALFDEYKVPFIDTEIAARSLDAAWEARDASVVDIEPMSRTCAVRFYRHDFDGKHGRADQCFLLDGVVQLFANLSRSPRSAYDIVKRAFARRDLFAPVHVRGVVDVDKESKVEWRRVPIAAPSTEDEAVDEEGTDYAATSMPTTVEVNMDNLPVRLDDATSVEAAINVATRRLRRALRDVRSAGEVRIAAASLAFAAMPVDKTHDDNNDVSSVKSMRTALEKIRR